MALTRLHGDYVSYAEAQAAIDRLKAELRERVEWEGDEYNPLCEHDILESAPVGTDPMHSRSYCVKTSCPHLGYENPRVVTRVLPVGEVQEEIRCPECPVCCGCVRE